MYSILLWSTLEYLINAHCAFIFSGKSLPWAVLLDNVYLSFFFLKIQAWFFQAYVKGIFWVWHAKKYNFNKKIATQGKPYSDYCPVHLLISRTNLPCVVIPSCAFIYFWEFSSLVHLFHTVRLLDTLEYRNIFGNFHLWYVEESLVKS